MARVTLRSIRRHTEDIFRRTKKTLGKAKVRVHYKNQSWDTDLLVIQGDSPNLIGWNWMHILNID